MIPETTQQPASHADTGIDQIVALQIVAALAQADLFEITNREDLWTAVETVAGQLRKMTSLDMHELALLAQGE